ncbi:uncharacterized protein LOC113471347 [Diaphorina citri]|uniref:Uncharacterized protein LOC113471347 n=1 Tax=Diaphorina citri TaxID=121845 RepID=A0A3Q0JHN4_DIACI|nr:uncharacterized protein LOC113471347 [Diaphorina citri]
MDRVTEKIREAALLSKERLQVTPKTHQRATRLKKTRATLKIRKIAFLSTRRVIRTHTLSILQCLLASRLSVTMTTWTHLIDTLSPVLCLLQTVVHCDEALGAEILQLTHPDLSRDMGMSKLKVIKSNACLLYHKEASIRLEATSRLAWYIRYTGVVTSVLSDLCVTPCNRSSLLLDVYEESSVTRVLELLSLGSHGSSPDEESQVRFSCLTQLSVMMDDVKLHRAFLTNGGVTLIVRELHELLSDLSPSESPRVLKLTEDIKKLLRRASIVQGCNTSLQVLHSTSSYTQAYTAVTTLQRYLDLQHIPMRQNTGDIDTW